MKRTRSSVVTILLVLTGWAALIGNASVGVLCVHASSFLHLKEVNHEEECCDDEVGKTSSNDRISLSSIGDCDHCIDFELKGTDEEIFIRAENKDALPSLSAVFSNIHFLRGLPSIEETLKLWPLMRAPPQSNMMTELCIKTTVLRL